MKVKIGSLEISDVTPDDLDVLVKRYGKLSAPVSPIKNGAALSGNNEASNNGTGSVGAPTDFVALKRLVEAGSTGVLTNDIGEILGKRGKAARGALHDWAVRIGLTKSDAEQECFEDCRVGTGRGVRIRPNLQEVAKVLLSQHQ